MPFRVQAQHVSFLGADEDDSPLPCAGGVAHVTAHQIAELKQTVSDLRKDVVKQPADDRRQQELEDENLNLKIRQRQLEDTVTALREHAAGQAHADPALRAELAALKCEAEQKQAELLQLRREVVSIEGQLEESRHLSAAAQADADLLRTQLASARALSEKYYSLKGDLWPLLSSPGDKHRDARAGDASTPNGETQLVAGLRQLREAHDREQQRAAFLDSELEGGAKQIAELENELTRRDHALADLQSGLISAMRALETRDAALPTSKSPSSPQRRVDGVAQTDPSDGANESHLDDKYLSAAGAGTHAAPGDYAEMSLNAAEELLGLRGRVEILQAELNGANRRCDALNAERELVQDKLKIVQDEAAEARSERKEALQRESAERREHLITQEKLTHQVDLAKERKKKMESLQTHLLNSQLALRDLEMRRMQDAARAQQLEADMAILSRSAEAAERQQRRAERIEEEAKEKLRQDKERAPRTSLEKRIMERERRQQQHDQADRCIALELKVDELVQQAASDSAYMQRKLSDQAKAAAKLSAKLLLERDKLISYILEVLRSIQSVGRHPPSKVARALATRCVHLCVLTCTSTAPEALFHSRGYI